MIYSMTGYGKELFEDKKASINVEIKSVNSKQFDLKLKLPYDLSYYEPKLRAEIQKLLHRGKIECYITVDRFDFLPYQINLPIAEQYFKSLSTLAQKLGYKIKRIDALQIIMRLPDVLKPNKPPEDKALFEKLEDTLTNAIRNLLEFRRQEGLALETDLRDKIKNIEHLLQQVPKYEQERIITVRERLISSLKDLKIEFDKERFEQEMIYYLDKYDINEEKIRLNNHLKYFIQVLDQNNGAPVGKKLNFIAQEIGREINTLGSKANHPEIQHLVVQMKDNLEQIKEQLANVL